MSEIVFVTPNFGGFAREEPVGTLLLATILRDSGLRADILQFHHFGDVNRFDVFIETAINKITAQDPKVVSFYTRCDTYHISLRIAEQLKLKSPEIYVVFAGPQADLVSIDTIQGIPYVDYVCCGEGETTIVPFFSSLIAGTPDHSIRGLVYRKDGQVLQNPRPDLIEDLDSLPAIDYSLLEYKNEGPAQRGQILFPVDVGRGCPFSCIYCSTKSFWGRKYRIKSAKKIIDEIKYIHEYFGETSFNFEHDMFTMNRGRIIEICSMLKTIGFPITWRCSARMDCIDDELIDIMSGAGMRFLFVGIESGSPRMQKLIHKNLKLDDIPRKLQYISSKGVQVTASFIYGFPDETEEDFAQTMQLMTQICTLPHITVVPSLCAFFAGTELTNQYYDQLEDASTYSLATKSIAVLECQDIIHQHPKIFPHFREFRTELREKTKYYPQFLTNWRLLDPVYQFLFEKHYKDRICDFLYDYTAQNRALLESQPSRLELLKNDRILEMYPDDEKYGILKEIVRYLLWRYEAKSGDMQVFGFNVEQLNHGTPIAELEEAMTAVYCLNNQEGAPVFQYIYSNEV